MNLPFFIANKIAKNKQATFSKFILRLATVATAISVAVMIVAMAVVLGFKTKIREKMFVFWGHAQITMFNANPSSIIGDAPFAKDNKLIEKIESTTGVKAVYPFIVKPVILKAEHGLEGLKFKGVAPDYSFKNEAAISLKGKWISYPDTGYSTQIVLSEATLNRMQLKIGQSLIAVFFNAEQGSPSVRKLQIVGSFHTGMEEVDRGFGICDIRMLRSLNHWAANDISALQVVLKDYQQADKVSEEIYQKYLQPPMSISTIKDIYPFIFTWLDFQNTNAALILIIMSIVAAINMATALLIYILERTQMIGTLKTLGMQNGKIQRVFVYHAMGVAFRGILWGTVFGLLLCWIQIYFQPLKLNEEIYYMKAAPIAVDWLNVLLIDIGTLLFCGLIMLIPALIVRSIRIVKALKFK